MSVSIASSIPYPIPGRETHISFTATSGNYVRLFCMQAPVGSEFRTKLDAIKAGNLTRVAAWVGDATDIWRWTPDVGGTYLFTAEEYSRGASLHGGGYAGDPDGYETETMLGVATYCPLSIGVHLTAPITVGPDSVTLELYMFDLTIRATTVSHHGIATPALTNPSTPRAKSASEASAVTTALTDLVDQTAATVLGTPSTTLSDIIHKFNHHRGQGSVHTNNDTDNAVVLSYEYKPTTAAGMARSANELRLRLSRHLMNDLGTGPGSHVYHQGSVQTERGDQEHALLPLTANETDPLATALTIADLWRAYEGHRVDTDYHLAADTTNDCSALSRLFEVYRQYLTALVATAPTTPSGASIGATTLCALGGLKEG